MKKAMMLLLFGILALFVFAKDTMVGQVVVDPYGVQILHCGDPVYNGENMGVVRTWGDLNNDDVRDLGLARVEECGAEECPWKIFLKQDGHYIYAGSIPGTGLMMLKSNTVGVGRISSYRQTGTDSGIYRIFEVSVKGVREVKKEEVSKSGTPERMIEIRKMIRMMLPKQEGYCRGDKIVWKRKIFSYKRIF